MMNCDSKLHNVWSEPQILLLDWQMNVIGASNKAIVWTIMTHNYLTIGCCFNPSLANVLRVNLVLPTQLYKGSQVDWFLENHVDIKGKTCQIWVFVLYIIILNKKKLDMYIVLHIFYVYFVPHVEFNFVYVAQTILGICMWV